MKSVYYIIFCLILFTFNLNGQNVEQNYFQYYFNIYKAEKEICNNNMESALELFDSTFNNYNNIFYYDMYNAAICASKLKKYQELDKILQYLAKYGYEVDFISEETLNHLDSLNNYQFFNILDELKSKFEENIDTNLALACSLRVENDQALNRQRISDGTGESLKVFHDTVYRNIEWLVHIIDSCGYPNRKLIGYAYEPTSSAVDIMIIHFYQHKGRKVLPHKDLFRWGYKEDSIINNFDRIPILEILSNEVKVGNMNLGAHVKLHNWIRHINEGKYFYRVFYNSDKWPAIFSEEQDSVLIKHSVELYKLIDEFEKQGETKFKLGESLYKLKTSEDYKVFFESKFGKK